MGRATGPALDVTQPCALPSRQKRYLACKQARVVQIGNRKGKTSKRTHLLPMCARPNALKAVLEVLLVAAAQQVTR